MKLKNLGEPKKFLCCEIVRDKSNQTIFLHQKTDVEALCEKYLYPKNQTSNIPMAPFMCSQTHVSLSTCESEYIAISDTCKGLTNVRQLCNFKTDLDLLPTLYCDCAPAISVAMTNDSRTHIVKLTMHYVHENLTSEIFYRKHLFWKQFGKEWVPPNNRQIICNKLLIILLLLIDLLVSNVVFFTFEFQKKGHHECKALRVLPTIQVSTTLRHFVHLPSLKPQSILWAPASADLPSVLKRCILRTPHQRAVISQSFRLRDCFVSGTP